MLSVSTMKQRIAVPDCARTMDPDGGNRLMTDALAAARGNREGRKGLQMNRRISRELLIGTLGCMDIMMEIMSFFNDEELLDQLMSYLPNFPHLLNVEICLCILLQRRVLYCKRNEHFELLNDCLQNERMVNSKIVVKSLEFPSKFVSMIEKFHTVHLDTISIPKRQLIDLMNASTSKIHHLKFTNFKFKEDDPFQSERFLRISPYLKKFSFKTTLPFLIRENKKKKNEYSFFNYWNEEEEEGRDNLVIENPIVSLLDNLDLNSSNLEELSLLSEISIQNDKSLLSYIGHKLRRLTLKYPDHLSTSITNLEYCKISHFPVSKQVNTFTLCVEGPIYLPTMETRMETSENVKKIILLRSIVFKGIEKPELRPFLNRLLRYHPNCEELILPETFFNCLSKSDMCKDEIMCSLKRIIVKHSNSTQPSKYGTLKFVLQSFFSPKTVVICEEIQKDEQHKFETLASSNRSIKVDCYEDILYRRIENNEKHFKVMDNSLIEKHIRKMKKKYCKCIISNNYSKFPLVDDSLNILEGLKRNKQLMLQTIHQAIENYHDIFDTDPLYTLITNKFDCCMSSIEGLWFSEINFSKCYSELEVLFHKMIQVIEVNGYPSKVLFNEQWFNEQIVELYGSQSEEIIEVYEDSQEEMEKASNELMLDDDDFDMEDVDEVGIIESC